MLQQENLASLKWWRGFRDRHPELSLRKPESIDHGRVAHAKPDIIRTYFDVLDATLEENSLMEKPYQIYNWDKAAVFLKRSTQKVLVPIKSKHCHALAQCTNQQITVLCCINAGGGHLPPLLPAGGHTRKMDHQTLPTVLLRVNLLIAKSVLSGFIRIS